MRNYDQLKLWAGYDYEINDKIKIRQPKIGEIIEMGEAKYFSTVSLLTATPSEYKAPLFDIGIDWENITDYDMFISFGRRVPIEDSAILFGDLNLEEMRVFVNEADEIALISDSGAIIDRNIHFNINQFLTKLHGFKKQVDIAGNAFTKRALIELNRQDIEDSKNKDHESKLLPLISTLVNSPGFKYNSKEVMNIGLFEFMDSVRRLQTIRHADAVLKGMCSGMVDSSKIKASAYDCFKDIA